MQESCHVTLGFSSNTSHRLTVSTQLAPYEGQSRLLSFSLCLSFSLFVYIFLCLSACLSASICLSLSSPYPPTLYPIWVKQQEYLQEGPVSTATVWRAMEGRCRTGSTPRVASSLTPSSATTTSTCTSSSLSSYHLPTSPGNTRYVEGEAKDAISTGRCHLNREMPSQQGNAISTGRCHLNRE